MPPNWELVKRLFAEAVLLTPDARDVFLDAQCGRDHELRSEVASLLMADGRTGPLDELESAIEKMGAGTDDGPAPGTTIGPYRLVRRIGAGGMGMVYEATRVDPQLDQRVALKLCRRVVGGPDLAHRFALERQILARLQHPNIAQLFDVGVNEQHVPFLVMEYVDGIPVDQFVELQNLGLQSRLRLIEVIADAVQYAHQNLVVHRDIKPDNILVAPNGVPKLLDFGIAKILNSEVGPESSVSTRTAHRRMTLDYASPEQVRGEAMTPASDIYSLGVLAYVLLTGRSPYGLEGRLPHEVERAICEHDPERPSVACAPDQAAFRRGLRGDVDTIILRALQKEPGRRYHTAAQFAEDIRRHLDGLPVRARPDSRRYRTVKFVKRHLALVGATGGIFVSLVLGLGVAMRQTRLASHERDTARLEADKARQVSDFVVGIFEASDPRVSLGQDVRALDLLQRGVDRLDRPGELQGQPAVRAKMRQVIGDAFLSLGQYDLALDQVGLALDDYRSVDFVSSDLVEAQITLGNVYFQRGDMEAAGQQYTAALATLDTIDGQHAGLVGEALSALAAARQVEGHYAEADSLLYVALDVGRANFLDPSGEVARILHNIGWSRMSLGDYDAAERAFRESLALRQRLFADVHPDVTRTQVGLASLLTELGQVDEAESLVTTSLNNERKSKGDAHPDLVHGHVTLARILRNRGRPDSASAHYERALVIMRRANEEDDVRVARILNDLGGVKSDNGELHRADALYREALSLYRRLVGERHAFTAVVLGNVAAVARKLGEVGDADSLYAEVIVTLLDTWGADHMGTARMKTQAGEVKIEMGDFVTAERLLKEGLVVLERELAAEDRRIIVAMEWLVQLYEKWGKEDFAQQYRDQVETRIAKSDSLESIRQ